MVKIQWVFEVEWMSSKASFFQRVPIPPEAHLALAARPSPNFQKREADWRKLSSSIFVSWISRMSGLDIQIRSFIESNFFLLPNPPQFQETIFITYLLEFWKPPLGCPFCLVILEFSMVSRLTCDPNSLSLQVASSLHSLSVFIPCLDFFLEGEGWR